MYSPIGSGDILIGYQDILQWKIPYLSVAQKYPIPLCPLKPLSRSLGSRSLDNVEVKRHAIVDESFGRWDIQ
jgi:hypothetical protein